MTTTRDTAIRLAGDVDQWLKAGNSVGSLSEHAVAGLADTFERAILAERERCARLIEANMLCTAPGDIEVISPRTNPGNKVGFAYAAAIRDAALAAPPVGEI